jgi:hypothetical protein
MRVQGHINITQSGTYVLGLEHDNGCGAYVCLEENAHMDMCVCSCISMCVGWKTHTCICTFYIYIYARVYMRMHKYACLVLHTQYIFISVYECIRACIYTCMCVSLTAFRSAQGTCLYLYVYINVCVCVSDSALDQCTKHKQSPDHIE